MPVSPEEQRRIDRETAERLEKENARREAEAERSRLRREAVTRKQQEDAARAAEVRQRNKQDK